MLENAQDRASVLLTESVETTHDSERCQWRAERGYAASAGFSKNRRQRQRFVRALEKLRDCSFECTLVGRILLHPFGESRKCGRQ